MRWRARPHDCGNRLYTYVVPRAEVLRAWGTDCSRLQPLPEIMCYVGARIACFDLTQPGWAVSVYAGQGTVRIYGKICISMWDWWDHQNHLDDCRYRKCPIFWTEVGVMLGGVIGFGGPLHPWRPARLVG